MEQRYRRKKDQKMWPGLAGSQDFAEQRGKMSKLGDVLSRLMQVKSITDGGLGESPSPLEAMGVWGVKLPQPLAIFGKNNLFNVIESHFARV